MPQRESGANDAADPHRTLRFTAMRDNIRDVVALVDAQTFGVSRDGRTFSAGVEPVGR